MDKWIELGKEMSLAGKELLDFVKERENAAREERVQLLELKRNEIQILELKKNLADSNEEETVGQRPPNRPPKLPVFQEDTDDLDCYLNRFERYAQQQGWPRETWAINLSALLTGKALEVYARLSVRDSQSYDKVCKALCQRFHLTEEGFRGKFRSARPEKDETPIQFLARLENLFDRWTSLANVNGSFDVLKTLLIREQYLSKCSSELLIFLKERDTTDLTSLGQLTERYVEARKSSLAHFYVPDRRLSPRVQNQPASNQQERATSPRQPSRPVSGPRNNQPRPPRTCYSCKRTGHYANECPYQPARPIRASCLQDIVEEPEDDFLDEPIMPEGETDIDQSPNDNQDDNSAHPDQDVVAFCAFPQQLGECCVDSDRVTLRCGHQLPIMSAACGERSPARMPVCEGFVGEHRVKVLRDSGCSGVVIRRSLVDDHHLTGQHRACVLIDGTVRRVPVAQVHVNTPYYTGFVTAICMTSPIYDLVLGNIEGVRCPSDPDGNWIADNSMPEEKQDATNESEQVQAVQTRAQKERMEPKTQPLKVPTPITDIVTAEDLRTEQRADPTLSQYYKLVEDGDPRIGKDGSVSTFLVQKGILYREYQSPPGSGSTTTQQVVLPKKLRSQVLKVAHESLLGGHQGIKKTSDRVHMNFYWPGMQGDITRYVQSCDICQRTFPKGRVQKVPLGNMPIIDTPFKRVAVDIVGPLEPRTSRGNKYILTMVDFATRYPEAVPLKNIEAITIADALVDIFSRIGVPQEILSDRGSQFTSGLFREVTKLLSMRQLFTTPYHPAGNGLVERFNGTLKLMLRRMCAEKPKDWDRYLGALLFAYREAPQASLGFSPFELIYGRRVRGPLTLLKEIWTGESPEDQTRSTYEYVFDLQNRLHDTCKLAHEHLAEAKEQQRSYYNRKSRNRTFSIGDKVLLLLPTEHNKLLLHWKGPFVVVGKQGSCDYQVDLNGQVKLFHANLLKAYLSREQGGAMEECAAVISEAMETPFPSKSVCNQTPALKATEGPQEVHLDESLPEPQQQQLRNLLKEFSDVLTDLPGKTNVSEHDIKLTSTEPFRRKQYTVPHALQKTVRDEVDNMLKLGIIEPSESPYASPIVLIDKKDGSKRFCIDFRTLNRFTVFDAEPLPDPEHIFASISQDKYFSKFDLTKGYWQVPVKERAKPYTAFLTPSGLFQFRVMPFGLVNAPATFTRMMRSVLRDLSSTDNFIDDILIHTQTWDEHVRAIQDLLERLREVGLTAKPSKCDVGCQSLQFLGHIVGQGKLQPQDDKISHVKEARPPRTKKELRSFLGFVGYYRRFIPNFATLASPLTDLTKAKLPNRIEWGASQEEAFKTLKTRLASSPILHLPDCNRVFYLRTDASNVGIGAVLLQQTEETEEKFPVSYASRKLLPREKSYATVEKEALAIVWSVQKYEPYLYGREFILQTDHQALTYLNRAKQTNPRIMRWALTLQPYRFRVESIKSSENVGADFLSRADVDNVM